MKALSTLSISEYLSPDETLWLYNGLDSCVTKEVFDQIEPLLDPISSPIYTFERELQAPLFEMMLRGLKIDHAARAELQRETIEKLDRLRLILDRYAKAIWKQPLNPNSPKQLFSFFYDTMKLPPIYIFDKGKRRLSANREALEQLKAYFSARPIILCILAIRDQQKFLQILSKGIDSDGRIRTSYNIAGTSTGRLSSSTNAFGTGDNLQNWTVRARRIIEADEGQKLAYIDLKSAESYAVAFCSGDEAYINACTSGDVHTFVAKLTWPDLPWTGDLIKDKALAEQPFYRHFTRRFLSKAGGHGSNYYGKPWTLAKHMKAELHLVQAFQLAYFLAFPVIPEWHKRVAFQLQTKGYITTAFGRRRYFLGRRWEDETLREAIAYEPQSLVADLLDQALLRLWHAQICTPLAQVHDAILIQYPEEKEAEIIPQALELITSRLDINGRSMTIPCEAEIGWNWGKYSSKNLNGIKAWRGHDDRTRIPTPSILDRVVR